MAKEAGVFRKLFPQKNIPIILRAVLKAGRTLEKQTPTEWENSLTRRLHSRLIRIYPFRDGPLSIQLQPEIPSLHQDEELLSGQIDLLVPSNLGYQIYFAIEAKRLRYISPNGKFIPGNSNYVNDGMMRFISGQYAPLVQTGAMLGYVFDGHIAAARNGINGYIQIKANELKIGPPKKLTNSTILIDNAIDKTHHDMEDRLFIIYHVFLSV